MITLLNVPAESRAVTVVIAGKVGRRPQRDEILRLQRFRLHLRDGGARAVKIPEKFCLLSAFLFAALVPVQGQRYEITPLFGGTFGGSVELEQQRLPNTKADIQDSISYGLAGGVRFDGDDCENCSLIEFRWMRQNTHLRFPLNPLVPTPLAAPSFRPSFAIDQFLGDFTHEFPLEDVASIRPFVTGTLGAALMSAPASSAVRFAFGVGAGMKVFPSLHWGFRIQAEYQAIVMHAELQRAVCYAGCFVILNGGLANQFQLSIGPAFRF
jgi:hypothetical protein